MSDRTLTPSEVAAQLARFGRSLGAALRAEAGLAGSGYQT